MNGFGPVFGAFFAFPQEEGYHEAGGETMKGVPLYVRVHTKEHTGTLIPVHARMKNTAFNKLRSAMNLPPASKRLIHVPKAEVLFPVDTASTIVQATKHSIDWYSEDEAGISKYDILKELLHEMDDYFLRLEVLRSRRGKTKIVWEVYL